jgi:hypothetical protein
MRLDERHSIRWLTRTGLIVAGLGWSASCAFQPGPLGGGLNADVDGGEVADAAGMIPDARPIDDARTPDVEAPDAALDAGVPIDATPGLVAHWPLDVIEGEPVRTTSDVVGGFHGEVRGSATIVPGRVGGAISLDGSSGFVRIEDVAPLDFTGDITLAAWCRPRANDNIRNIVVHGTPPTPDREVYLRIANEEYQAGSWTGPGSTSEADEPMPSMDAGNWVHLAAVFDGTWRLYRNGAQVDTGGNVGPVSVDAVWAIGARPGPSPDRFFEGEIDDVRIYDRALTPAEVGALANPPPP